MLIDNKLESWNIFFRGEKNYLQLFHKGKYNSNIKIQKINFISNFPVLPLYSPFEIQLFLFFVILTFYL